MKFSILIDPWYDIFIFSTLYMFDFDRYLHYFMLCMVKINNLTTIFCLAIPKYRFFKLGLGDTPFHLDMMDNY